MSSQDWANLNKYRDQNEKLGAPIINEKRVVFIGDSITQGWERNGKGVWAEFYGKRNAVNLGIGGDRTQHVIWRLDNDNVKDISPKAAVVMIGGAMP